MTKRKQTKSAAFKAELQKACHKYLITQDEAQTKYQEFLKRCTADLSDMICNQVNKPFDQKFPLTLQSFLEDFDEAEREKMLSDAIFNHKEPLFVFIDKGRNDLIDQFLDLGVITSKNVGDFFRHLCSKHGQNSYNFTPQIQRLLDDGIVPNFEKTSACFDKVLPAAVHATDDNTRKLKLQLLLLLGDEKYHPDWNLRTITDEKTGNNLLMRALCACFKYETHENNHYPYVKNALPLIQFFLDVVKIDPAATNKKKETALHILERFCPHTEIRECFDGSCLSQKFWMDRNIVDLSEEREFLLSRGVPVNAQDEAGYYAYNHYGHDGTDWSYVECGMSWRVLNRKDVLLYVKHGAHRQYRKNNRTEMKNITDCIEQYEKWRFRNTIATEQDINKYIPMTQAFLEDWAKFQQQLVDAEQEYAQKAKRKNTRVVTTHNNGAQIPPKVQSSFQGNVEKAEDTQKNDGQTRNS